VVLGTEALLVFYLEMLGAGKLRQLLEKTQKGEGARYLNIVNLNEFSYLLQRRDPSLQWHGHDSLSQTHS